MDLIDDDNEDVRISDYFINGYKVFFFFIYKSVYGYLKIIYKNEQFLISNPQICFLTTMTLTISRSAFERGQKS